MNDLYAVMNSLTPKELPDLKSTRKINGAVDALEKACKPYFDKTEKLQKEARDIMAPFTERFKELEGKEDPESNIARAKTEADGNKLLEPINKKLVSLSEKEGQAEVVCEIDANYLDELKVQFKAHGSDKFTDRKALIEVADAIGLED